MEQITVIKKEQNFIIQIKLILQGNEKFRPQSKSWLQKEQKYTVRGTNDD
jgi:hypothetical protein